MCIRDSLFGRRVWLLAGCRRGYPADHVQHRRALGLARRRERVELRLEARVLLAQLVQLAAHLPPAPIASPRLGGPLAGLRIASLGLLVVAVLVVLGLRQRDRGWSCLLYTSPSPRD